MKLVSIYTVSGNVRMLNNVVINTPAEANNGSEPNCLAKIVFVAPDGIAASIVQIDITMGLKPMNFKIYAVTKGSIISLINDTK
jgi:hypothetical protein